MKYLIIILATLPFFLIAQDAYVDSVNVIVNSKSHDSVKVKSLTEKAWALIGSGSYKPAILFLDATIDIARNNNLKVHLTRAYLYKGIAYRMQSEFKPAIENLSKALALAEKINNLRGQATSLSNLGIIYEQQNNIPKSFEYYSRALKIRELAGDKDGMIHSYNDLAILSGIKKDYKNSLNWFKKAQELSEEIGDSSKIALCNGSLGTVYLNLNDLQKAEVLTKKALDFDLKNGDKENLIRMYCNMGQIMIVKGKSEEGIDFFKKAMDLAGEINVKEIIKEASHSIAMAYYKNADFKNAFDYLEIYSTVKDSILNGETSKQMAEMNAKYEAEKKDKLILQQQTESQKQQLIRNAFIFGFSVVLILMVFVFRSYVQKKRSNEIIKNQKAVVEEKQKEILDSINYAKRIQFTLLAHDEFLNNNLPSHFVYFQPKDIVSGDFYWATKFNGKFYLAVCDSTGHGVPGAFMSLLSINFLNEAITERNITKPNEIFDYVRSRLIENMSREGQRDGFDGVLLCLEMEKQVISKITYAAANNNIVLIRNGKIIEGGYDKMPVGLGVREDGFNLFEIEVQKNDNLYLYTDGYADQFGGVKGKKYKYKQLNDLLISLQDHPSETQKNNLSQEFNNWKGELEQVDDVCIIGIRI